MAKTAKTTTGSARNANAHSAKLKKANEHDHEFQTVNLMDDDGFVRVDENFEKVEFKKPGDNIVGYFTGFRTISPPNGEEFRIITFLTKEGKRVSTPANYSLVKELEKETEMTTTMYKIVYTGESELGGGRTLKNFEVYRKPNCPEILGTLIQKG